MFLTTEEVIALTGRKQRSAQIKMLRSMGIDHRVRGDGVPVVMVAVVEKAFGLKAPPSAKKKEIKINWDAIP